MIILVAVSQLIFALVATVYFVKQMKSQREKSEAFSKHAQIEQYRINKLRKIALSKPLSEKAKPTGFDEIIGQDKGILALKATLCGPYPQHVIIYGPPGVGKTAAARVVLEEAKKMPDSPFKRDAKFIETDATIMRFDERGIADPLIGSVHDPIYQGAGAFGNFGVPQPKPGAVTRAHGGILFIDEIGELHPIQMNKLLKILEDGKVFLESAYYNPEDKNTPSYIKDVFDNGLPADFRLIGATTRSPSEIPPAIRSRCIEIFFDPLSYEDVFQIVQNTARKSAFYMDEDACSEVAKYAQNGRDAVNIVQIAAGIATVKGRSEILLEDVEWVIEFSKYSPRLDQKTQSGKKIGTVCGLAVSDGNVGTIMEIEVKTSAASARQGKLTVTGMVEEEETDLRGHKLKRKSTAISSVQNVLTVLENSYHVNVKDYDIHINFPGGMPVDGPSAGISIFVAVFSSIFNLPIDQKIALTGELSIKGSVRPVGGVIPKVEAAKKAQINRVIIPKDNYQKLLEQCGVEVLALSSVEEVLNAVFSIKNEEILTKLISYPDQSVLTASGT